jgi:hypothetical protein
MKKLIFYIAFLYSIELELFRFLSQIISLFLFIKISYKWHF